MDGTTRAGVGAAPGHDGPLTAERAVSLVEQLAASPGGPRFTHLAPEHLLGRPVGPPADVYALACILFELLSGTPPFTGDTAAVVHGHLHTPVPPLRAYRRDLPPALEAVIAVGTAKNPHDRHPTAHVFAAAARAALTAPAVPPPWAAPATVATPASAPWTPPPAASTPPRRRLVIVGAVAAVLLLAVGVGITLRSTGTAFDPLGISGPVAARPVASAPSTAPTAAVDGVPRAVGRWSGTYTCAQGRTGLRLTVSGDHDDALAAIFRFSALPENPDVPDGAYTMSGTDTGKDVTLRSETWIKRPLGYAAVDLVGELGDDGRTFDGSVQDGASICTTFHLERVADDVVW